MMGNMGGHERPFVGRGSIEHELTERLERAHELGRRAEASNDALLEHIRRAQEIADGLSEQFGQG